MMAKHAGSLKYESFEYNDENFPYLYDIFKDINSGFRRSVGIGADRGIFSSVGSDVDVIFEIGYYG